MTPTAIKSMIRKPAAKAALVLSLGLILAANEKLGCEVVGHAERSHVPSPTPAAAVTPEPPPDAAQLLLQGPSFDQWKALQAVGPQINPHEQAAKATKTYPNVALARYYKTDIYTSMRSKPLELGYIRRGAQVLAKDRVHGKGCKGGRWYPARGGGYVCSTLGFTVAKEPGPLGLHYSLPDPAKALPYRYSKVITKRAPRFYSLPSVEDDKRIPDSPTSSSGLPEAVEKPMDGVFFLALHDVQKDGQREFYKTVYGRYVRKKDVKVLEPSPMHGELLGGAMELPLAFVFGEDRKVYRQVDGKLEAAGMAAKHARFPVGGLLEIEGKSFVRGPDDILLSRDEVRVVETIKRPSNVPSGLKWVHVDIAQQTLVAYEGERPVFATIISGGKEGYEAPKGTYRVRVKHVTVTMNGPDPIDKWYEVEEVPWTLFYYEGYAIHGAYWHNDFGKPRSHGCTNMAPVDARWLFYWVDPKLPSGWHGMRSSGTYLHFTG